MILNLIVLISMVLILFLVNITGIGSFFNIGDQAALAFGFILLASYVSGLIARRAKLPMITGFLLAGFLFGPNVLGAISPGLRFLTPQILDELSIFNTIALGLIAFSAGGEMKLDEVKKSLKGIAFVSMGQSMVAASLTLPAVFLLGYFFDIFSGYTGATLLGIGLLFAVIAMANSPSSTIALIVEYKAKGPMTTMVLGVTILKDVVVIIMFSFAMIAAKILIQEQGDINLWLFALILWEVLGSIAIGCGLGFLMGQYMKYVGRELPLILLALAFIAMELAHDFHLSGLLLCMFAGFYVENFTDKGKLLIGSIERYSLPIYVLFFTITGANLQLQLLVNVWPVVLVLVLVRTISIWAGTTGGAALAGGSKTIRKYLWLGFITQAGVTLGLATIIEKEFGQIGAALMTIIVATVAVNQIIGPVLFRFGLLRSGEGTAE